MDDTGETAATFSENLEISWARARTCNQTLKCQNFKYNILPEINDFNFGAFAYAFSNLYAYLYGGIPAVIRF